MIVDDEKPLKLYCTSISTWALTRAFMAPLWPPARARLMAGASVGKYFTKMYFGRLETRFPLSSTPTTLKAPQTNSSEGKLLINSGMPPEPSFLNYDNSFQSLFNILQNTVSLMRTTSWFGESGLYPNAIQLMSFVSSVNLRQAFPTSGSITNFYKYCKHLMLLYAKLNIENLHLRPWFNNTFLNKTI